MRLLLYISVLVLASFLTGCEKYVKDIKLPPFEQKLAIASFISPSDSVSCIFVGSNRRIYGELGIEEDPGILSGTISDGIREVQLDTALYGLQVSRERMSIVYGKTYSLRITSDKGLSSRAACTVPGKREFIVTADTFSILVPHGAPPSLPFYLVNILSFRALVRNLLLNDLKHSLQNNLYKSFIILTND